MLSSEVTITPPFYLFDQMLESTEIARRLPETSTADEEKTQHGIRDVLQPQLVAHEVLISLGELRPIFVHHQWQMRVSWWWNVEGFEPGT